MTKEEKNEVVKKLTKLLSHNNTIYLTDTSNISANKILDFRKTCFKSQVNVNVVKNKLLKIAINSLSDKTLSSFNKFIKGNNSIISTNTGGNIPAKIIKEHRDKFKDKKPFIKAVFNEGIFYSGDNIDVFINIKSKKELIIDIINTLKYKFTSLIFNLNYKFSKIFIKILEKKL